MDEMLPIHIRLDPKTHLPLFDIFGALYTPVGFLRILKATSDWRVDAAADRTFRLTMPHADLILTEPKACLMCLEWSMWKKYYLPPFSLEDLTVLDVGAGCGETAALFFMAGARNVICIEPAEKEAELLAANIKRNGWNAELRSRPFEPEDAMARIDFMKMDCEGCEESLLTLDKLPPSVIEVHSPELRRALMSNFNMKETKRISDCVSLLSSLQ